MMFNIVQSTNFVILRKRSESAKKILWVDDEEDITEIKGGVLVAHGNEALNAAVSPFDTLETEIGVCAMNID